MKNDQRKKLFESPTHSISVFEEMMLYIAATFVPILAIPGVTYEFMTQKYAAFTLILAILFGILVVRAFKKPGTRLYFSLPHLFLGLFALAAFLSGITVMKENPYYLRYTLDMSFYVLLTFFVSVYISNRVDKKAVINRFLFIVLSGGMFVAVNALVNFYTGYDIWLGKLGAPFTKINMKSTIGNPNFVADFLGMMMPVALYFMLSFDYGMKVGGSEKERRRFYRYNIIIKILATVYYTAFTAVVLLATNRSTYISVVTAFVIFGISLLLWRWKGRSKAVDVEKLEARFPELAKKIKRLSRTFLIIAIVASVVLVWIYSTENPLNPGAVSIQQRIGSIVTDVGSREGRLLSWTSSIYQWKAHKIFGTGIGTYQIYTITYLGDVQRDIPGWIYAWNNFKRTHNDYLQVLGETGIIGFLSILGMLVGIAIIYFSNLLKMEDSDDVLLLITIAAGFIVIMLHSATSFPVHLMPNGMVALFLGSVGVGRYFNKEKKLSWEIELKGWSYKFVMISLVFVAVASTVMRWNFFLGEVMFRWGNVYYKRISAYQSALNEANAKYKEFTQLAQDLENYSGRFENLEPSRYLALKLPEYEKKYPQLSKEALILRIGREREEEIKKLKSQIESNLQRIKQAQEIYLRERDDSYFKAIEYLQASLSYNPAYGKSMFYLGLLCSRDQRRAEFLSKWQKADDEGKLQLLKEAFVKGDPVTRFIPSYYTGSVDVKPWIHPQSGLSPAIPLMERQIRDFPLKDVYKVFERANAEGISVDKIAQKLNLLELYLFQQIQDNVDYFEGSFLCFNEKNSYRVLARHYVNLYKLAGTVINRLVSLKKEYPSLSEDIDKAVQTLQSYKREYLTAYKHWYDKAVYILPGTWNRFPDWEGIYSEYLSYLMSLEVMSPQTYSKIKEVVSREIWVSRYMAQKIGWGIPDKTFERMKALAQTFINNKMFQEALTVINDIYDLYLPAYQWNKELLEQGKVPSKVSERAKTFVERFENFENTRAQFILQLRQVFQNVIKLNDKSARDLYEGDWKRNVLTGEEASLTLEQILEEINKIAGLQK